MGAMSSLVDKKKDCSGGWGEITLAFLFLKPQFKSSLRLKIKWVP